VDLTLIGDIPIDYQPLRSMPDLQAAEKAYLDMAVG
jgi:hypothetical protein